MSHIHVYVYLVWCECLCVLCVCLNIYVYIVQLYSICHSHGCQYVQFFFSFQEGFNEYVLFTVVLFRFVFSPLYFFLMHFMYTHYISELCRFKNRIIIFIVIWGGRMAGLQIRQYMIFFIDSYTVWIRFINITDQFYNT